MSRGDQLSRRWRLLQLTDRPRGITVDDAARDLAVTVRTISALYRKGSEEKRLLDAMLLAVPR